MKLKGGFIFFTFCIIVLVVFMADDSLAQCSMCQKIAIDGVKAKTAGNALNHGILYLLALPYCMLAIIFRKQIASFIHGLLVRYKK